MTWYQLILTTTEELTCGSFEATYIFFLLIYQLTFPAIVYTLECKFREPILKNKWIVLTFIFFYILNTYLDLYPFPWLSHLFSFYLSPSWWWRVEILLFVAVNGFISVVMELLIIDWCICERVLRCCGFEKGRDPEYDGVVDRDAESPFMPWTRVINGISLCCMTCRIGMYMCHVWKDRITQYTSM